MMDENTQALDTLNAQDAGDLNVAPMVAFDDEFESDDAAEEEASASEDNAEFDPNSIPESDLIRTLEAMLFASAQPLSLGTIRERLPEGADIGGMLIELQKTYEGRGVSLVNMEGNWAFRTAPELGSALQLKRDVRRPLSRAAMETLAIVAYHQPVTRAEIENIRGVVTSGGTLDILMEAGWVKPGRRREAPGRPLTWVTTTQFLDQFGLQTLTDLPGLDDLKASGLLDRRPAIDATTSDLFEQMEAEDEAAAAAEEDVAMTEEELAELKAGSDDEDGAAEFSSDESDDEDDADDESEEESHDDEDEDDDDDDEEEENA